MCFGWIAFWKWEPCASRTSSYAGLFKIGGQNPVDSEAITVRRPRARDLGIVLGRLPCGELNAITDVEGV